MPQEAVTAHRRGDLVLFVGAGASMAPPSSLPSFSQLTRQVARELQVPEPPDDDHLDTFLGQLQDQHGNVHSRVKAHIDRPGSTMNAVHTGVAALALAGPPVRIVTTNYDPHLSSALQTAGDAAQDYLAPALPMGDDFDGIVYLHGKTDQASNRLVLTDRDFGRAYLTDAWASRFLERMFSRFTILFIGYSHNDIVMSYLARGLRPDGPPRYALTDGPDDERWKRLGIEPVAYDNPDGTHFAVQDLLHEWASEASRGLLDHRQRLAEITQAPPSGVPEEQSYLEDTLSDPVRTSLFVEQARGEAWLKWVAERPQFQPLVNATEPATAATYDLARWIAEHFVADETNSEVALQILTDAGGRPTPTLWHAIGHWLHITGSPRPDWLDRWIPLLIATAPQHENDWLSYALMASSWPEQQAGMLALLDHLIDPQPALRPSFGLPGRPSMEIRLRDDHGDIRRAYEAVVEPHLNDLAEHILIMAERALLKAHVVLTSYGAITATWDPLSFGRSAIQPHFQDAHPEPLDLVIDMARDALAAVAGRDAVAATAVLIRWAHSSSALLRRLAVNAHGERQDLTADAKVLGLLAHGWLQENQLRQEVYHLLAGQLTHCSETAVAQLVAAANVPPDDSDDNDSRARARYDLLGWISRHAPNSADAQDAFAEAQQAHPEWIEREEPGFASWMSVGSIGYQPPMPPEVLADLLRTDPDAAVTQLLQLKTAAAPWDGPTWDDALTLVATVVTSEPQLGYVILDVEDQHSELVASAIQGWAVAELDEAEAEAVARRLHDTVSPTTIPALTRLLAGSSGGKSIIAWHAVPATRELAELIGDQLPETPADGEAETLSRVLNDPAGHLAQYWLRVVAYEWSKAAKGWTGLPADLRRPLEALLGRGDAATAIAEVLLASNVLLLFQADRAWCTAHVSPLLSWDDAERARRTWDGYLVWGRHNDELLRTGLLEQYLRCAERVADLPHERHGQLAGHLAGIAVFSSTDPLDWTPIFTARSSVELRVAWLASVAHALADLDELAVEAQWRRWLGAYWSRRLDGVPLALTPGEATAIAAWALPLHGSLTTALEYAVSAPASLGQHSDILWKLGAEHLARSPEGWATLLAHLLAGATQPLYEGYRLHKLVRALRDLEVDTGRIVEEAIRLGCATADW